MSISPILPWLAVAWLAQALQASEYEEAEAEAEGLLDGAPRFAPHLSGWLLGGQDFSSSSPGGTGLGNLLAAGSLRMGEGWRVMPLYHGYYQTRRQVLEAGGGSVLFQSRMDHRVAAKIFLEPPEARSRLKFSGAARFHILSETKDEPWGRGLFDDRKVSGGVEWEYFYRRPDSAVRLSYDYYSVTFPNYATLESRGLFQIGGQPVARELVGGRVLDSRIHSLLAGATGRLAGSVFWDASYTVSLQAYPDQRRINPQDQFEPEIRHDVSHDLSLSLRRAEPLRRGIQRGLRAGMRTGFSVTRSDQNSYNVIDRLFFPGYYDYREWRVVPSVSVYLRNPREGLDALQTYLALDWAWRQYPHRPAQDGLGAYGAGHTRVSTLSAGLVVTWPFTKSLNWIGSYRLFSQGSNMEYERFYRYNFTNQAYLLGLGYEL